MGKHRNKDFTQAEVEILSNNKHVRSVTTKQITYTDEFKGSIFDGHAAGKMSLQIFVENCFIPQMICQGRIDNRSSWFSLL